MAACSMERGALKDAEWKAIEARAKKLDSLRDAMKRDGVMNEIEKNGGLKNALETLHSIMRGSNKLLRDSIENNWHSKRDGWLAALNNELYKGGLKKAAESGALDKDVSVAWWKLSNGKDAGKGPAASIAKLYNKALDSVREMQNAAGARIGDAKNYVTTTQWDTVRMRQAAGNGKTQDEAFEAWFKKDYPRMANKTFDGVEPAAGETMMSAQKKAMRDVFDTFLSGVFTKVGAAESGYMHPDFSETSNVGRKVAAHRAIVWKDGVAWHEHMQDFGSSASLHAAVTNSVDRGARALALMDKMGNNPGANLNMIIRRVEETYMQDADGINKFRSGTRRVVNEMKDLDGTLNIPANMGLEKFTSGVMATEAMASLGGVAVTHFASIWPTVTSELAHHGVPRMEAFGNIIKALGTGMGDQAHRDLMADIGAYADGAMRHIHGKIGDDTVPGHISNWSARFMDATGIHVLFDRTKAGIRDMLAHNLGRNIDREWKDLDPHLTNMLTRYRIGPEEWGLMKGMKDLPSYSGRSYLTPSAAAEGVDDKAVEAILAQRGKLKDSLTADVNTKQAAVDAAKQRLAEASAKTKETFADPADLARVKAQVKRYGEELQVLQNSLKGHQDILGARDSGGAKTPDIGHSLDRYEAADAAETRKAINAFKQDLSDKILSYYTDAAKHGVVTAGVRERALLLQGTQKGTGANTLLRFMTQFKMWPVAAMSQILERDIYMSLSGKEAAFNIGKLVAIGVPAGYIRMVVSDYARGHPARDPSKPETLLAAAAQSGGLGIFGDFLFGEASRMGGGLVSTLGGPVASDADQLIKIFGQFKNDLKENGPKHRTGGEFGDIWPNLVRFGVRHIPFANLIYLKGALDYMLLYHLYEASNPGWWDRSNRRLLKEQGRAMTGYTPGGGIPYGVPGIRLSNQSGQSSGLLGAGTLETQSK